MGEGEVKLLILCAVSGATTITLEVQSDHNFTQNLLKSWQKTTDSGLAKQYNHDKFLATILPRQNAQYYHDKLTILP